MSRAPLAAFVALVCSGLLAAAEPDRRELRIGADVFRAALAENLPDERRVLDVEAGYLAGQGVLLLVELTRPWFTGPDMDVNPEIAHLEQIPEMVQNILKEVHLGLAPEQAEELEELREIRAAQRELRAEQRELRARIREVRRDLLRADDSEANALRQRLDELTEDLAAADREVQTLETEATDVRASINTPGASGTATKPADLDRAIARTVCAYGATFRSPPDDQHLNVAVKAPAATRYYAFRMTDARQCQSGALTPEALLDRASIYEG